MAARKLVRVQGRDVVIWMILLESQNSLLCFNPIHVFDLPSPKGFTLHSVRAGEKNIQGVIYSCLAPRSFRPL